MSTTTLTRTVTGATPSSVTLRSIVRTDTDAAVATSPSLPAAFEAAGGGVYTFVVADPAPGLTYRFVYRLAFASGQFFEDTATQDGTPTGNDGPSYLTYAQADALAATLPAAATASYAALGTADRQRLLVQASADVDAAGPYQGRRYDADPAAQPLEFPRVPYPSAASFVSDGAFARYAGGRYGEVVWDLDPTTREAVVPRNVEVATLHQANAIAEGTRAARLDARHDGLASQSVAGLSESYVGGGVAGGGGQAVCRAAAQLLRPYRLQAGRML